MPQPVPAGSRDDGGEVSSRAGTVGRDLKVAREHLGWSLDAVAEALRIRFFVLQSLETGRFADLPAAAYTLSFLRSYACALGLDADDMVRRFRAERTELSRKTQLEFPAPAAERSIPVGAVVLLGCVLAIGSYAGWYHFSGSRQAPAPVHQVPQRLADMVKPPVVPPAPPPPAATPAPAVVAAAPAIASATTQAAGAAVSPSAAAAATEPASAGTAATPAALPAPVSPSSAAAAVPTPSTFTSSAGAAAPPQSGSSRTMPLTTADTWLEVRDPRGHVVLNRVLHAGDSWAPPPAAAGESARPYVFTTGNAGGTEVEVDGKVIGPLGKDGAVRHNLVLDAGAILGGSLTAPVGVVPAAKAQVSGVSRP